MPPSAWSRLSPWIESLILSYGGQEESHSGLLKARVIEVGDLSKSQDFGSECPTGLLFLSDGLLQIPAILTKSAWEHLQQEEDRECFTSLVNTTVCIHDYQLQFHMAMEKTKCRFVLSIRELSTTATGPVKGSTICSTALPSIRKQICMTRKGLLGQETQDSQCVFDLSELLGEWQQDCLEAVLEDVRERLMAASSQPSTSTWNQLATYTDTSWGVDRVRYKGVKAFNVPMKCLLISAEDAQQNQTPLNVRGSTASELFVPSEDGESAMPPPSETTSPSNDNAEWRIAMPEVVESDGDANETLPCPVEDSMLQDNAMADMNDCDLSNPWDTFPPPWETLSSSDASPSRSLDHPATTRFRSEQPVIPVCSSRESQQTSEPSNLPPYQKLQQSAASPSCVSLQESLSRPSEPFPSPDQGRTDSAPPPPPSDQKRFILEKPVEETAEREYRKVKRKRSEPTGSAEEAEAQISGSPPSWLFDTQAGSGANEGSSPLETAFEVSRNRATVHSDGCLFSYSYQVSGQNLQDFSRFKVAESFLQWAVKYLVVPKQTGEPAASDQTLSDEPAVTSL
ncbi:adrenocortical dysplasia protein homolog [Pungitius pungitius]|uniref:adrenocortical dysplasia protein homolog n=1 Tax=Pungitius pungitius TaxID=134920 RepID=UPI001886D969|nr:adrenocortical dysplasia protein homolog [Pungitius pungitius]XP_037306638.1 adrenocortical dysplasia protein homolog [Pungitius pungitius]XP_037306639.1 adrenocortical dysplasia protein homolog [Pungitius pungitius]XP_037306640.1 adrenocortical dysplasia protein homolog [Pungitius pungitius]XP_037306641.1 adrenocortical dysplasia protein homolog [Pungitius pungitius]XP_037306642.1 adrenocortical dysplasia protein homolog [Pungitius pungitius]